MTDSPSVRRVILGTAGHIDHGKTALVEQLTGTRTDRLREEQERGMTIDVGYAEFVLADGTEVGLLDVPGHERLVRTMVAAATAMDLALLVVAADDGPMPQTREHVEILDVLGVKRLVVALTKTDLGDPDLLPLVEEEIESLLEPTGMRGAPVVRVSSATGEGVDALRQAIANALPPPRPDLEPTRVFRMPVLRAFSSPGRGTVVTGIPLSGTLADGQAIEVLPVGWKGRVRGIQVHRRDQQTAEAHLRTALALSDVTASRFKRGLVVTRGRVLRAVRRVAAEVRLLGRARPIEHGDRTRLHVGAAQVVVRVHVLDGATVAPGETRFVELEAFEDLCAAPGDRIVLRTENASETLGGGRVLELLDRRLPRKRAGVLASLAARSRGLDDPSTAPAALIEGQLERAGHEGTSAGEVAALTALDPARLDGWMDGLVEAGVGVRLGHDGQLWMARSAFERVLERIESGAERLHKRDPALTSLPASAVRTAAGRIPTSVLDAALARLFETKRLVQEGRDGVRLHSHSANLSASDEADLERVSERLAAGRGQPPAVADLEADLTLTRPRVMRALKLLVDQRRAFRAGDLYFDGPWLDAAKERLAAHAKEHGGFAPADARSLLDTTRKWVIPLLEALDKTGFSRRVGDRRIIRT